MAYSKQENKFTLFAQMNRLISNSFFTNFLASSLTRFFNLGISFISSIIVSRYLGPEGRGYLAFMLSIGLTVSQFFAFGVPAMNTYILSKNEKNKMAVAANSILILALLSVIISFFIFVIFPFYYEVRLIDQLSILFFSIFNLMGLFFSNALLGLMRVGSFNKLEIIRTTSATVAILILIYTGAQNYIYFFLASVFSVIVYGSVSFIFLVNIKQIKSLFNSIDIFLIKNFTSFVSKSYFSSLLAYLITRINFFVIPLFLNDKELGIYATAYSFLDIFLIFALSVNSILFPKLCQIEDIHEKKGLMSQTLVIFFVFSGLFSFFIFLTFNNIIIFMYGEEFAESAQMLMHLLPSYILLSLVSLLSSYVASYHMHRIIIYAPLFSLFFSLGTSYPACLLFGAYGLIWSLNLTYFFYFLIYFIFFLRSKTAPPKAT